VAETGPRGHRIGSGNPLLLIHGLASRVGVCAAGSRALLRAARPDLLGHHRGGEPFPRGVTPGIGALTDGLERELDAAGCDTAHIAGSSLGGWLALELAKRGRARSVVALAPGGGWRAGSLASKRIELTFTLNRPVGRRLLPHAERLCASTLGRRLLFRRVSAHPERLEPARRGLRLARLDRVPRLPRRPACGHPRQRPPEGRASSFARRGESSGARTSTAS
jgi:pimeloyl-ACP methyl ester carboxylesterase